MSTTRPKYSTEMHQNTSYCAELNGEYAGEGFMPLRITIDSFADMDYGLVKLKNHRISENLTFDVP